jgi:tRNA (cmo5U34)-methyltransferase
MASALNQFNSISAIYDAMVWLVFGSTLHKAQCHFIDAIPPRSKILIIGGGTGKFLKELLNQKPQSRVVYIESASEMIAIARKKADEDSRVTFIHGTQNSIPQNLNADVVITPFFLDLFSDESLKKAIDLLKASLGPHGIWIATDFTRSRKFSHRILLRLMYAFFRLATRIESKQLPSWEDQLLTLGKQIEVKTFRGGFIKTAVYKISE